MDSDLAHQAVIDLDQYIRELTALSAALANASGEAAVADTLVKSVKRGDAWESAVRTVIPNHSYFASPHGGRMVECGCGSWRLDTEAE